MRKSTAYVLVSSISIMLLALLTLHAHYRQGKDAALLEANEQLVKKLQLTDLCLFTEARYTRHPAMADLHAPFQDHPLALEHFPSGSLVTPPRFRHEGS